VKNVVQIESVFFVILFCVEKAVFLVRGGRPNGDARQNFGRLVARLVADASVGQLGPVLLPHVTHQKQE
jgi:hypothetical protein